MAFPRSLKTNWIVKSYDTTGKSSADLNPFEFAILDVDTYTSLSSLEVQGKDILFAVGSPNTGQANTGLKFDRLRNELNSELSFKSQPYLNINAIKSQVFTKDDKTNVYYLGYNGLDDCKSLVFECGKTYEFDVYVKGRAVRNIFGQEMREVIQVTTPCCTPCTDGDCAETIECNVVIDELVRNFNDKNRFISRFYTAEKVVTCATTPTPDTQTFTKYCLTVCDNGDEIALANVQNQVSSSYSKVTVKERNAPYTTYEVTEVTSGAGTPTAFVQDATVLQNCSECPSGFTLVGGGFAYLIEVDQASSAESSLATLQALNGFSTLTSRSQTGWSVGVGTYYVTSSALLTTTTADAKILKYYGATQDTCTQDTAITSVWFECGECYAVERTMFVTFGANDCDPSANILAAWTDYLDENPTLAEDTEITLSEDGCFWRGSVIQPSNCIEDGCDTVGVPVWETLPTLLGFVWEEEPCVTEDLPTGCSCGIKFTGRSFSDLSELLQLPIYDLMEYVEKDPIVLTVGRLVPDGQTQVCDEDYPTFVQTQYASFRTLQGRDVMKEILTTRFDRAEPYWNLVDKDSLLLQQREGLKYGVDVNGYYFAITISGNVQQDLNWSTTLDRTRQDIVLFIHEDDVVTYEAVKALVTGAFPNAKYIQL